MSKPNDKVKVARQHLLDSAIEVAWYDMITLPRWADQVSMLSYLLELAAKLEPGEFEDIDVAEIPEPLWQAHRADATDPRGPGLLLKDEPSIVGVIRNDRGEAGLLIGYQLRA